MALKKPAAIFFLLVLAFNIAGYRWLFTYIEQKATTRLEQKIDAGHYADSQLMEIKIPLNMPYYSDRDYEPAYGETEWNGQHYRYVKRKICGNTLYLLCIPHEEKNNIVSAKSDFVKAMNDVQQKGTSQKSQQPSVIKLMLSEFIPHEKINAGPIQSLSHRKILCLDADFYSQFIPLTPAQPPEIA